MIDKVKDLEIKNSKIKIDLNRPKQLKKED